MHIYLGFVLVITLGVEVVDNVFGNMDASQECGEAVLITIK